MSCQRKSSSYHRESCRIYSTYIIPRSFHRLPWHLSAPGLHRLGGFEVTLTSRACRIFSWYGKEMGTVSWACVFSLTLRYWQSQFFYVNKIPRGEQRKRLGDASYSMGVDFFRGVKYGAKLFSVLSHLIFDLKVPFRFHFLKRECRQNSLPDISCLNALRSHFSDKDYLSGVHFVPPPPLTSSS